MARYIDADALGIGKAKRDVFNNPAYADGWNSAIEIINNAPTIEARPVVMGQWLVSQDEYFELYTIRCSVCHEKWCFEEEGDIVAMCYNYCPKCGNPMLVVKKEVQDEAVSEA